MGQHQAEGTFVYDPQTKKATVRGAWAVPRQLFDYADEVEILDMSQGRLSSLPDEIAQLTNLKVVFLSENDFEEIPPVLARCSQLEMLGMKSCRISRLDAEALPPRLRALILTDNRIEAVSPSIGKLARLQKLTLTGNKLRELPRELLQCAKLELVRFAANDFSVLPEWLLELPRLAWYADAGNPGSMPWNRQAAAPSLPWSAIALGSELGRSSKNVVYEAQLADRGKVAVKLYGGEITADGNSADEIQACLAVGEHKNIITTIGEISGAPDGRRALAMSYVPDGYTPLADPPDFVSQTRDRYGERHFTLPFAMAVLNGVAAALRHLHACGIMHGDLYAHNILVNRSGRPYLGDFGAASPYAPGNHSREQADIRAFLVLMDELLSRCPEANDESMRLKTLLRSWQAAPVTFEEIGDSLAL